MRKTSEIIALVKEVFTDEPGASLLQHLEDVVCKPELFDESTNRTYWRVGQTDLVRRLKHMVAMSSKDVEEIIRRERQSEHEDKSYSQQTNEYGDLIV